MVSRIAGGIGLGTLLLVLTLGAWTAHCHTTPLAGRYHLRQRTTQFFDRAKTPTTPAAQPSTASEPLRTSKAKQPRSA